MLQYGLYAYPSSNRSDAQQRRSASTIPQKKAGQAASAA